MSRESKHRIAGYALLAGMMFLVIGITADMVFFTWVSILLVLVSLIIGGRWKRRRKP